MIVLLKSVYFLELLMGPPQMQMGLAAMQILAFACFPNGIYAYDPEFN